MADKFYERPEDIPKYKVLVFFLSLRLADYFGADAACIIYSILGDRICNNTTAPIELSHEDAQKMFGLPDLQRLRAAIDICIRGGWLLYQESACGEFGLYNVYPQFPNVEEKQTKRISLSKSHRLRILERDSFTCQYCGRSAPDVELHVDHVEPVSKGGKNDDENLVAACVDCNLGKRDRILESLPPSVEAIRQEVTTSEA